MKERLSKLSIRQFHHNRRQRLQQIFERNRNQPIRLPMQILFTFSQNKADYQALARDLVISVVENQEELQPVAAFFLGLGGSCPLEEEVRYLMLTLLTCCQTLLEEQMPQLFREMVAWLYRNSPREAQFGMALRFSI
jgi:hypothetical protein